MMRYSSYLGVLCLRLVERLSVRLFVFVPSLKIMRLLRTIINEIICNPFYYIISE